MRLDISCGCASCSCFSRRFLMSWRASSPPPTKAPAIPSLFRFGYPAFTAGFGASGEKAGLPSKILPELMMRFWTLRSVL